MTPIHVTAALGHMETVRVLVQACGGDPNTANDRDNEALLPS